MNHILDNGLIKIIVSDHGAQLLSLTKADLEYLWQGDPLYWTDHAPILFPYVGRLTQGRYRYADKAYSMDIHGFAKDLRFQRVDARRDCLEFELREDAETLEMYPFQFCLTVRYRLEKDAVHIEYEVRNLSEKMMYFGIGGHPGFNVPFGASDEDAFEDYYLEFDRAHTPERVLHTPDCLLSGGSEHFPLADDCKINLCHELFDDDAVVLSQMGTNVALRSRKHDYSVTLRYPDMAYLGLWHAPHKKAPYVCIEPWTSLPSRQDIVEQIEFKSDLIRLHPGKMYCNNWSIAVD